MTDLARQRLEQSRANYLAAFQTREEQRLTQRQIAIAYEGFDRGSHKARTFDGGTVEIEPLFNGSAQVGELLAGVRSGNRILAIGRNQ